MINIFKSIRIWDHIPTPAELRDALDPGKDPVIKKLPADGALLSAYLDLCGLKISYNGALKNTRYSTELLYYINLNNEVVTTDLQPIYENMILDRKSVV